VASPEVMAGVSVWDVNVPVVPVASELEIVTELVGPEAGAAVVVPEAVVEERAPPVEEETSVVATAEGCAEFAPNPIQISHSNTTT
jgi:hypothetical protein